MGVFASGRLIVNPAFVARLKQNELVFVLAHELLHLALRTHDRAKGSGQLEFNYAHDYIINDILRAELGFTTIPAGGLDMPGARNRSAEDIVLQMRKNADLMPSRSRVFEGEAVTVRRALSRGVGQGRAGDPMEAGDVLDDKAERELFPDEAAEQGERGKSLRELAVRSLALAQAMGAMKGRGGDAHRVAAAHGGGAARALSHAVGACVAKMDGVGRARRADVQPSVAPRRRPQRCGAARAQARDLEA